MLLKKGDLFLRDDYSIAITDIRQLLDMNGKDLWKVSTEIFIDDLFFMSHGFKTEILPNRSHFTAYADRWIPQTIQNYLNE